MGTDKAAGSLVKVQAMQSQSRKLSAALHVKRGIVTNRFAGSLESNSHSSCVTEPTKA